MRTKIFMVVMLMGLSTILIAQTAEPMAKKFRGTERPAMRMKAMHGGNQGLNLTDAQKEAFKANMLATQKQLQPLRNALGEAEAHQKTLVTAEKPDFGAINKNIEKIGGIRIEMAKIQAKNRLDMRAQLTDEQKLKFDLFKHGMRQGKGPKGPKGMM
ncbi:MAG: Spy/CpxP family protein refolding chaperone [Prolixibacteraceae bacterium]|jgi:Spy/CpxP family protein refolding chaperone|nr:Spy/CpxP family protein refolding chaperone [Prolixibacteraceae bacterium]